MLINLQEISTDRSSEFWSELSQNLQLTESQKEEIAKYRQRFAMEKEKFNK